MMMEGSFTEDGWKVEGITFVEDATSHDEAIYSWGTTVSHCAPAPWPACGIRCCCQKCINCFKKRNIKTVL
jgi:hypothetical protein